MLLTPHVKLFLQRLDAFLQSMVRTTRSLRHVFKLDSGIVYLGEVILGGHAVEVEFWGGVA